MFEEFLNESQIYLHEKLIQEYYYLVLLGGLILLYFIYDHFTNNSTIQSGTLNQDILRCMEKYNINEIYEFPNLLSDEECDKIIEMARPLVKKSTVIGLKSDNDISDDRTSTNTFIKSQRDPLLTQIDNRIQSIIGINPENYEDLQVVNYKPGQLYNAHWDACDPKKDDRCHADSEKGGLRFATFIIYLNDDMEGGHTEFPLVNKVIQPKKGKGVLFFNLDSDLQGRRELSKHAGLPPTKGEKWMCNKWIRLHQYPR
jgi:prolyl 4-hydroxylase|tara:strand:- start:1463 stop:2233 length:771 start_codon:yes stop_codon:yes gene_type:complete